ncbi:MAG: bacteriohemerythrin [Negativicutes bacterium]|nr:bacteriohemerythrin [Negativicutes bacterium]
MAYMKPDDIVTIGIPALDDQHQGLVSVVNDMYEEIAVCGTLDEERVLTGKFLETLQEYARVHFEDEEAILVKNKYPKVSRHKEQHRLFIKELQKIRDHYASGELALSFDVFLFSREWIANHINVSDQEYSKFLNL